MKEQSLESLNKYLFGENERLNATIDELEERINKAIDYIKKHDIRQDKCLHLFIFEKKELLEILGGKE